MTVAGVASACWCGVNAADCFGLHQEDDAASGVQKEGTQKSRWSRSFIPAALTGRRFLRPARDDRTEVDGDRVHLDAEARQKIGAHFTPGLQFKSWAAMNITGCPA
jgi:hypothetical protein